MTPTVTSREIESQWFGALYAGDCRLAQRLLEAHPNLLKVGLHREPNRIVKRVRRKDGKEVSTTWAGSSVLIQAASTGCADLISQALKLCNVTTITNGNSIAGDALRSPPKSHEISPEPNLDESGVTKREIGLIAADPSRDHAVFEVDQLKGGAEAEAEAEAEAAAAQSDGAGLAARLQQAVWTVMHSNRPARLERKAQKESENGNKVSGKFMSRKDLRDLLLVKSGWWNVDAITVAVLSGNDEALGLLVHAMGECENPPYGIERNTFHRRVLDEEHSRNVALLRRATEGVLAMSSDERSLPLARCRDMYRRDPLFNFLPIEEFLFHFSCTANDFEPIRQALWSSLRSVGSLWRFVLNLHDAGGRPPVHVAVEWGTVQRFMALVSEEGAQVVISAVTARDGAGRTAVHRAAATGRSSALKALLAHADNHEEVAQSCQAPWQREVPVSLQSGSKIPMDMNLLSQSNGFGFCQAPYTPVHAALIHERFECARLLIKKFPNKDWGTYRYPSSTSPDVVVELDTMELACLKGADISVTQLLKDGYKTSSKTFSQTSEDGSGDQTRRHVKILKHPWHALHLVAASGNYENLKLFLGDSDSNPSVEDFEGNTPLHHALLVRDFGFQIHLLDCFHVDEVGIFAGKKINPKELVLKEEHTEERQRCIDRLLQSGCDIFKANQLKKIPYPTGDLESNGKLMSWWCEKQSKELETAQNDCINAANAISVTAALVAATSYVGPLQPPLSYAEDGIRDHNVWVVIFMVCDTMSFYLAIAAITLSLIPSLPTPRRALKEMPHTTRDMVTLAVTILFPSVVFVFVAFASSSIAVVSANVTSSVAGRFTIATTFFGGVVCLAAFSLFSIKLLGFLLPDNTWITSFNKFVNNRVSRSQ